MKALAPLAIIVIVAALYFSLDPVERDRRQSAAFYEAQQNAISLEREQLRLDTQRADAERANQQATTLLPLQIVAAGLFVILGVVVCYAGTAVALDAYRMRRVPLVWPDHNGLYPLARPALVEGHYDQLVVQVSLLAQEVRAIAAAHQHPAPPTVPHSLNYSPHFARHDAPALLPAPGLAEVEAIEGNSFADLLDTNKVGKGNPLHLGFSVATGKPLAGSWLDLYSTAVAGMSGTGKTTSQRFLAAQCALHGARFAVVDPHAGAADDSLAATLSPLSSIYLCEPASADKAILEVVRLVADTGQRRVSGRDSDRYPLILWVDELTSLLGRSSVADDLAELLEKIAQEYRKVAIFCCASGQIWTASRATSELRDSFASVLCHRMKRGQARLLLPTEEAETVERLPIGQAVLWRTSGEAEQVIVPNTTAADLRRVGQLLVGNTATPQAYSRHTNMPESSQSVAYNMPIDMPESSQREASDNQAYTAAQSHTTIPAEARRAAALFLDGSDPAAIVMALRGIKSSEGKRYQTALAEILNLVRAGLANNRA